MEQKEFEDKPIPIPLTRDDMQHIIASLYLSSDIISPTILKNKESFYFKSRQIINKILTPYIQEKLPTINKPRFIHLQWKQIDIDSCLVGAVLTFIFIIFLMNI